MVAVACVLGGCSTLKYYSESISGQWQVMTRQQDIDDLLANDDTPPRLRTKLQLATSIRQFAFEELGLPDNGSYQRYVDLQRPYVVWNVFATPELSLDPVVSCFPFAGCLAYRGFFSIESAQAYASELEMQGMETYVGGVAAYSTLGWFRDPLLSSMLNWSDTRLAEVIFHELAHQRLYVEDDTDFNEAFAMVVGSEGVTKWLEYQKDIKLEQDYILEKQRDQAFVRLLLGHRKTLADIYGRDVDDSEKRSRKAAAYDAIQQDYAALKLNWQGYGGYDRWMEENLNNAKLLSVSTYQSLTEGFKALLAYCSGEMACYYQLAGTLGQLSKADRHACLQTMASEMTPDTSCPGIATRAP